MSARLYIMRTSLDNWCVKCSGFGREDSIIATFSSRLAAEEFLRAQRSPVL